MANKILNFPDAMKLASIISKYFDTVSISKMTGDEFAYELFNKIDPDEIVQLEMVLFENKIPNKHPKELMILCVKALIKNDFFGAIDAYKRLGFK